MDITNLCPLCESGHGCYLCKIEGNYTLYHCETFKRDFYISNDITRNDDLKIEYELREELLDCIAEFLLYKPFCSRTQDKKWHFFYSEDYQKTADDPEWYINTFDLLKSYPTLFTEKIDHVILNLSTFRTDIGDCFSFYEPGVKRLSYYHYENLSDGILEKMTEMGYMTKVSNAKYSISARGWERIDELQKKKKEIRQGFIAMRFGDETKNIREAFRKGITESGYAVRLIDEKEHNNQIVPEIFYEIGRSKFVVVDVTYPNYGAYYEAGYAQALGKQVIVCCREEEFDEPKTRPHFDIAQKSMIVWKDEDELVKRLKRRIEATVE